jgi:hypothetical protein
MQTAKQVPLTQHHPKAPDASVEKVRALAGIVRLTQPVPTVPGLERLADDRPAERAGD